MINGVLIPGGGQNLSPGHAFYDTSKLLLSLALDSNDRGDYFPVSGLQRPPALRLLNTFALH